MFVHPSLANCSFRFPQVNSMIIICPTLYKIPVRLSQTDMLADERDCRDCMEEDPLAQTP